MAIKFDKKGEGDYVHHCQGYACPHLQIYTKKILEKISLGDVLEVIFDNPSSSELITEMCSGTTKEIIGKRVEGGEVHLYHQERTG